MEEERGRYEKQAWSWEGKDQRAGMGPIHSLAA